MAFDKRIGILGGTFDPIHNGHIFLAENAIKKMNLDSILVMPTYIPYYKAKMPVSDYSDRAEMIRLASEEYGFFEFSDFEKKYDIGGYTYKMLTLYHKYYPDQDVYFVVSGDVVFSIEKWKNADRLLKEANIIATCRSEQNKGEKGDFGTSSNLAGNKSAPCHAGAYTYDFSKMSYDFRQYDTIKNDAEYLNRELEQKIKYLNDKYGASVQKMDCETVDISSSQIRENVRSKASISGMVPKCVEDYIYSHLLYV